MRDEQEGPLAGGRQEHHADETQVSEAHLRQIVDLIPHLLFVKDQDGRFLLANEAFAALYGRLPADITGRLHTDLHQHKQEEVAVFLADDREVMETQQPKFIARESLTDIDGRQHWVQLTKIPYAVYGASVRAILGVGIDISEQERMRGTIRRRDAILQAIRFSAEQFLAMGEWEDNIAQALEAIGVAAEVSRVCVFENGRNTEGQRTITRLHGWAAPARVDDPAIPTIEAEPYSVLGLDRWEKILSAERIIYGNLDDFPPQERQVLEQQQVRSIAAVPVFLAEHFWGFIAVSERAGERVWSAAELDALKVAASTFAAALQRRRAERERDVLQAQVQQTQKLESLGVFAGGVAHDFNNLLMAILGNANLVRLDLQPDSPACRHAEAIELAAQRAADLTRQMLAYAGKGRFVIEPIDLTNLIRSMFELIRASLPTHVDLVLDLAPALPSVEGDPSQIRQVVSNLVTNAAEAMGGTAGTLIVRTRVEELREVDLPSLHLGGGTAPGDFVTISIQDTGGGIPEENVQRIFDPFFTTKFAGRGLGLAAVLGIVRSHQGGVQVVSVEGSGTTIRVYLPVAPSHPASSAHEPERRPPRPQNTVLVIDDEPPVRDVTAQMLRREGFVVDVAEDGFRATQLLKEYPDKYGFVLLDMSMPGMGGEEVLRWIRTVQPRLPVLLASGFDESELGEHILRDERVRFIQKPYRRDELLHRLTELRN